MYWLIRLLSLSLIMFLVVSGCSQTEDDVIENSVQIKPVKTIKVQEKNIPITIEYFGVVTAADIKKLSFKTAGQIENVYVKEGQRVEKGQELLKLNTEDIMFAVETAKQQLEGAKAQYEKIMNGASKEEINQMRMKVEMVNEVYYNARDSYGRFEKLYNEGAISRNDLDKAKLDLVVKENQLNMAREALKQLEAGAGREEKALVLTQYKQAKTNYEQKLRLLEQSTITSNIDGYVADILVTEGEMISAGYPAIIVKGERNIVNVGLSHKDIDKVKIGTKAKITCGNRQVQGEVTKISRVPDERTGTFEIEIVSDKKIAPVGTVVDAELIVGSDKGVLIPVSCILNDKKDYVFIVQNNKAVRKNIDVKSFIDGYVLIEGLKTGDMIIVDGSKALSNGDTVDIKNNKQAVNNL